MYTERADRTFGSLISCALAFVHDCVSSACRLTHVVSAETKPITAARTISSQMSALRPWLGCGVRR